jgi:glycosyltransferase involved in cell wall biosynthesis
MDKITNASRNTLFSFPKRNGDYDLVVFCHLRWDFVYQRPQHVLSRLANQHRVLFVEEPIEELSTSKPFTISHPSPNVTVFRAHLSGKNKMKKLGVLVQEYLESKEISSIVSWFYSAAFIDVLKTLEPNLVIYDCMDELAAFKGASPLLISQEKRLLKKADIVFTGGKSLYESKKERHHNVFCFPSSVDEKHFQKCLKSETVIPNDIQNIPQPIVGFYGVIDERLNVELLKKVAEQLPRVSFVMIGPVVKIDPQSLPQLPNIHYLGNKSYAELPQYLKAFHVAMMPFALNESTRFISPTKTLEFMAALKPIISTPIIDVKRDYTKEVKIVKNAAQFAAAIQHFLAESESQKQKRITLQKAKLRMTSWERTVREMNQIISDHLVSSNKENLAQLGEKPVTSVSRTVRLHAS